MQQNPLAIIFPFLCIGPSRCAHFQVVQHLRRGTAPSVAFRAHGKSFPDLSTASFPVCTVNSDVPSQCRAQQLLRLYEETIEERGPYLTFLSTLLFVTTRSLSRLPTSNWKSWVVLSFELLMRCSGFSASCVLTLSV